MAKIQISQKKVKFRGSKKNLKSAQDPPPPLAHFYIRFEHFCSHILLYGESGCPSWLRRRARFSIVDDGVRAGDPGSSLASV